MNELTDHNGCESVRPLLSPYIDNQTSAEETALVESHLATCAACQSELAQLRQVVAGLQALPQVTPPRSFAIPATTPAPVTLFPARHLAYLRGFAAAVAACLVLVLGLNAYMSVTVSPSTAGLTSQDAVRTVASPQEGRSAEPFAAASASEPAEGSPVAPAPAAGLAPAATPVGDASAREAPPVAAAPPAPQASPEPSPGLERLLAVEATPPAEPVPSPGEQKNAADAWAHEADGAAQQQSLPVTLNGLWVTALVLSVVLLLSLVAIAYGSRGPRAP